MGIRHGAGVSVGVAAGGGLVGMGDGVGVAVAVAVGAGVAVAVGVGDGVEVAVGSNVAVAVGCGVSVGCGAPVGVEAGVDTTTGASRSTMPTVQVVNTKLVSEYNRIHRIYYPFPLLLNVTPRPRIVEKDIEVIFAALKDPPMLKLLPHRIVAYLPLQSPTQCLS
jgi:hypothetical protein